MYKTILLVISSLIILHACGDMTVDTPDTGQDAAERISVPVDMLLSPGNLTAGDEFSPVILPIQVSESNDLIPIQVGARILELNGHDPDYLRIEFVSDRIEWVGYTINSIGIYESEEQCLENEEYCEEVIVGEGKSGYFEIEDGHIAIQNAYCRYDDESYDYTISAIAYDLSYYPAEIISDSINIQINCAMID